MKRFNASVLVLVAFASQANAQPANSPFGQAGRDEQQATKSPAKAGPCLTDQSCSIVPGVGDLIEALFAEPLR